MELKLVVLAGAKEGTQIPLKKDKFLIGRSTECTLRAGSSAISRRHCGIVRTNGDWLVRDLGSRNGTFLNDTKVETPTALSVGDELRVGPLHFRVEEYVPSAEGSKARLPAKPETEAKPAPAAARVDEPQDINRAKKPPAKDVAEVAKRTASQHAGDMSEDDISRWLLGIDGGQDDKALKETQTLSMEETTTISRSIPAKVSVPAPTADEAESAEVTDEEPPAAEAEPDEKSGSSGWNLFKLGKGKAGAKKQPGKLPPRPSEISKDSREAAADILREMTRRR
jgi:pSer/pThr/pTyr-binding forkhead associated (FHA) protein